MKRIVAAAWFTLIVVMCFGQTNSDTSTIYRNGLPISEDDTVTNFPGVDFEPLNHYNKIKFEALPQKLQEELQSNSRFSGWRDSLLYFDEVNDRYYVAIPVDSMVQIFGFDARGNVVTFDEQPPPDQR
ncbi:MAG TPA: hypothetical protein VD927_19200 [Chryseosolibacter sp.]|nr:hypothetical protein [Chryseosolibacter sp.]